MDGKLEVFKETISEALVSGWHTSIYEFNTKRYDKTLFDHIEYDGNDSLTLAKKIIKKMMTKAKGMSEDLPFVFFTKRDKFGLKQRRELPKSAHSNEKIIQRFLFNCYVLLKSDEGNLEIQDDLFLFIFPFDSTNKTAFLLQIGHDGLTLSYKEHAFNCFVEDLEQEARNAKLVRVPFGYADE